MAADNGIHVGDVGTQFTLTITDANNVSAVFDISAATLLQMTFVRGDGTSITVTASFVTNGTDGKMQYVSILGDIAVSGNWQVQGYIVLPKGKWHTSTAKFKVFDNISGE